METKRMSIGDVEAWLDKANPRTLKSEGFERLKRSLLQDPDFLEARPIIVSERDGERKVIAGNMRVRAAKAAGFEMVPVVIVEGLDAEAEKRWQLKDNLHVGEWDMDALANNYEEALLLEVGFDPKDIKVEKTPEPEAPEVPFTEELGEEHNYVVLYFDNDVDWIQAQSLLDLGSVKALHSKPGFEAKGLGRVLKGREALNRLTKRLQDMHSAFGDEATKL